MIRSRFKIWTYLLPVLLIAVTWLLLVLPSALNKSAKNIIMIYLFSLLIFTWLWLFFGELRTKAVAVVVENRMITRAGFLGLGPKTVYDLACVDGFVISLVPSKTGSYEYLYLIKEGRKIVKLSEFYHSNYYLLKEFISLRTAYLGDVQFSMIMELREIFK